MDTAAQSKRMVTSFLLIALLFIVLGVGNLLYGSIKYKQYVQILENIKEGSQTPVSIAQFPLIPDESPQQLNETDLRHVYSRLSFYELVTLGGKSFLGIAGVFLLLCLLTLRQPLKAVSDEVS